MTRTTACLFFAAIAAPAAADFNPVIDGAPATYTPGTPFDITVRAGELRRLGLYSVQLDFRTVGPAGGRISATAVPPSDPGLYPFLSAANFSATGTAVGDRYSLTVTDFSTDSPLGVNTVPFSNDTIAVVTVTPSLGLAGPIRLSVNLETLSWLTTDGGLVPYIAPEGEILIGQADGDTGTVPAPAGLVLAFAGFAGLAARRAVTRRV